MGRRAKYLTQEEKRRVKREQQKEQKLRTTAIDGRISHCVQNRVAHQKRKRNKPQMQHGEFPGILSNINIPSLLKEQADITLPTSSLFKLAYQSIDGLEDTEYEDEKIEKWNSTPPYTINPENESCQWLSDNVQHLLDALHGKNLRHQREYEDKRICRYKSMPLMDFALETYNDLLFYISSWEGANRIMAQFEGDETVFKVGMQYVQWMARRSFHLWEDYEALKKGSDAILCDYVERWIRY